MGKSLCTIAILFSTCFVLEAANSKLIRRTYIDLAGRTPSYQELNNTKTQSQAVNEILDSNWYVNNMYNLWADWLRLSDRRDGQSMNQYKQWLLSNIQSNRPYDEMVYDLISASGNVATNGASGFYVRDKNNPLDHAAFMAETFLGEEINCAQCHNHPFKELTQLQFYETAAYTYGVRVSSNQKNKQQAINLIKGRDDYGILNRLIQDMFRYVDFSANVTNRKLQLPHDYQYKNAKPKQEIQPGHIIGYSISDKVEKNRELYAQWMVSKRNKLFVENVVLRLNEKLTGSKEMSNERKIYWMNQMVRVDFDLKKYLAMFMVSPDYLNRSEKIRRMTSEQIWDSFVNMYSTNYEFSTYGAQIDWTEYIETVSAFTPKEITNIVIAVSNDHEKPNVKHVYQEMGVEGPESPRRPRGYFIISSEQRSPADDGHFLRQFGQSNRNVLHNDTQSASVQQALTLMNGNILNTLFDKKSNLMTEIEKYNDKTFLFMTFFGTKPTPQESRLFTNYDAKDIAWMLLNSKRFIFYE